MRGPRSTRRSRRWRIRSSSRWTRSMRPGSPRARSTWSSGSRSDRSSDMLVWEGPPANGRQPAAGEPRRGAPRRDSIAGDRRRVPSGCGGRWPVRVWAARRCARSSPSTTRARTSTSRRSSQCPSGSASTDERWRSRAVAAAARTREHRDLSYAHPCGPARGLVTWLAARRPTADGRVDRDRWGRCPSRPPARPPTS